MKEPSYWVLNYAKRNYTSSAGKAVNELLECYKAKEKELSDFKALVKQMIDKRKELNAPLYISEGTKIAAQLSDLEQQVDKILGL